MTQYGVDDALALLRGEEIRNVADVRHLVVPPLHQGTAERSEGGLLLAGPVHR